MAHLHGNQWRQSKSAMAKKERAKQKHFNQGGDLVGSFIVPASAKDKTNVGIVIETQGGKIVVLVNGERLECSLPTAVSLSQLRMLVPGDMVRIERTLGKDVVTGVLERTTVLSRMRRDSTRRSIGGAEEQFIAANIDVAVIVVSAKTPPFHPKFIDRYLILVQHNSIEPIVCLNKCELATKTEIARIGEYAKLGIRTIKTSALSGEGVEELKLMLHGKMAVMVGHSGVGKTSLINAIDPSASYRIGDLSAKTGKGRHTTIASVLREWSNGAYIIDTPGIRALEIWDIEQSELQYYFPEIAEESVKCKYSDCLHSHEPFEACAVKQAVGKTLSRDRYESYIKILEEL